MNKIVLHLASLVILCLLMSTTVSAQQTSLSNLSKNLPCLEKSFCVRVMMTVDSASRLPLRSEEEIKSIFEKASEYFSPICMSFNLCEYEVIPDYSYNNLYSSDRLTEMGVVYAYPRRLNVLFVNHAVGFNCGYAPPGGFTQRGQAQIYIELSCADGAAEQLAKHMGTLLGLADTNYRGFEELADGSNCEIAGDGLCSTPADPYGYIRDNTGAWVDAENPDKVGYNVGCEFTWEEKDDNGHYYTPSMTNMMSPYPCKCQFTHEQFLKMVERYQQAAHKLY